MITKTQLKKFFDVLMCDRYAIHYSVKTNIEALCNDKYRFEAVTVMRQAGKQFIFDADEERRIEVSKGAAFTFYKITRTLIK